MRGTAIEPSAGTDGAVVCLRLLGRFAVLVGGVDVPVSAVGQRLLVRLALGDGAEDRPTLAGQLWPEHSDGRSQANLRGAMWRLPEVVRRHLAIGPTSVCFLGRWDVDLLEAERVARSLFGAPAEAHGVAAVGPADDAALFRRDLLPDWSDPWLLVHRERHRQLRLHALEELARRCLRCDRPLDATDCALLAVSAEPLRESAQVLLLRGHLAAGNRSAALRCYEQFRRLLDEELGVAPSCELTALVQDLEDAATRRASALSHRG